MRRDLRNKIKEWKKAANTPEFNHGSTQPFSLSNIFRQKNSKTTEIQETNSQSVTKAYKRYKKILDFKNKYVNRHSYEPVETVELNINRGIGTSSQQMSALLELIPGVYGQEFPDQQPDTSELITIARNSYYFLVSLASEHLEIFSVKNHVLGTGGGFLDTYYRYKPEYFRIVQTINGKTISLKEPARRFIEEYHENFPKDYTGSPEATGCPALIDFKPNGKQGGSAIKKLWDWYLELAGETYKGINQAKTESKV